MTNILAALQYLEMGFSFFPVGYRSKFPKSDLLPGYSESKPSWIEYQKRQPTEAEARAWFEGRPELNIALVTGKVSNLIVVDIDNQEGFNNLKTLCIDGFTFTWFVMTGRGYHIYFACPRDTEIRNKTHFRPGLDVRGEGGYVLAPPSIHPSGRQYRWGRGGLLFDTKPRATLPPCLAEILIEKMPEAPTDLNPLAPTLSSPLSRFLFNSFMHELANAPQGERNDKLNKVAFQLARICAAGALLESECRDALHLQALAIGLDEGEIDRTINSGFRAGLPIPWNFHEGRKDYRRATKEAGGG